MFSASFLYNVTMNKLDFIALVIITISFFVAYNTTAGDLVKFAFATPGVLASVIVFYQEWNKKRLQEKNNDFVLGAGAHMSELVYKKHASFCQKYINRIEEGRVELYQMGPSKGALKIGHDLVTIRKKYSAWLTKNIEQQLKPFENALIKIGVDEHYLEHLEVGDKRSRVVNASHELFRLILGIKNVESEVDADIHIDKMIEVIRDILGVSTLTDLRIEITKSALNRLSKD